MHAEVIDNCLYEDAGILVVFDGQDLLAIEFLRDFEGGGGGGGTAKIGRKMKSTSVLDMET